MNQIEEIKGNINELCRMIKNETSDYYSKLYNLAEEMENDIDYHVDKIKEELLEIDTDNDKEISITKSKQDIKQFLESMPLISNTDRGLEIAFMTMLGYGITSITAKDLELEKERNRQLYDFIRQTINQINNKE